MGNRAVICGSSKKAGLYLHWNGGRDSVNAFLTYCKLKEYRGFASSKDNMKNFGDDSYALARLCQVICNWFGGSLSVGVSYIGNYYKEENTTQDGEKYIIEGYEGMDCNNCDNGMYIVEGWDIVGREFFEGHEQDNYNLYEFLIDIDNKQPKSEQLGSEKIIELLKVKHISFTIPEGDPE